MLQNGCHVVSGPEYADCSPQILPVNYSHRPVGGLEIVEQPRVNADIARFPVPASIRFERRAVGIQVAAARAAEMVGDLLRVPTIDGIAIGLRHGKLVGRKIGIKMPPFRAERAGAPRQLLGQLAINFKSSAATMAVCG